MQTLLLGNFLIPHSAVGLLMPCRCHSGVQIKLVIQWLNSAEKSLANFVAEVLIRL